MRSLIRAGLAIVCLSLPGWAEACPVCFSSATEEVLHTYYLSAAMLTLLPLLVIGTLVGLFVFSLRRARGTQSPGGEEVDLHT